MKEIGSRANNQDLGNSIVKNLCIQVIFKTTFTKVMELENIFRMILKKRPIQDFMKGALEVLKLAFL